MSTWYYAIDGQRYGPVALAQLQALATAGRLTAADSVWTEGWPDWRPAAAAAELAMTLPSPAAAATSPTPLGTVNYHGAHGGMPPRAARALAGYAPPTGDVGDWPLDDARVARLVDAARHRRRIRQAFAMYRSLCVLSACAAVIVALTLLVPDAVRGIPALAVVAVTGVTSLFAVLYGLAAHATRRNHNWGGWAIVGMLAIASLANVGVVLAGVNSGTQDFLMSLLGNGIGLLLNAAFLVTTVRGIRGVRGFRASPAWCQEALLRGEARHGSADLARVV